MKRLNFDYAKRYYGNKAWLVDDPFEAAFLACRGQLPVPIDATTPCASASSQPIDRAPSRLIVLTAPKMQAARNTLRRLSKNLRGAECMAKLDRMQGSCDQDPTRALIGLAGFRSFPARAIQRKAGTFRPYRRAQWFHSQRSTSKFAIESEALERWLSPFRLTLFADDVAGLLPGEVFIVLELVPDFQLTMIELAFDYPEFP
jgi:hypothetical protein